MFEDESSSATSFSTASTATKNYNVSSSSSSSSSQRDRNKKLQQTMVAQFKQSEQWVKHVLISQLTESGFRVCELNCGSGTDIGKWARAKIEHYTGFDSSREELRKAEHNLQSRSNPFPATFRQLNPFRETIRDTTVGGCFDVVACFRLFGQSFESPTTAREFLRNVSCNLKPGGYFFGILPDSSALWYKAQKTSGPPSIKGSYFKVTFDDDHFKYFGSRYTIHFNNVSHSEYLVHFPSLLGLAKNEGLSMVEISNFVEFFEDNKKTNSETLQSFGLADKKGRIAPQLLDLMGLYTAFIFEKKADA